VIYSANFADAHRYGIAQDDNADLPHDPQLCDRQKTNPQHGTVDAQVYAASVETGRLRSP
jgi:hypothetical protein